MDGSWVEGGGGWRRDSRSSLGVGRELREQAGELPAYRSRLGAQTMARLRACMLVLALCVAMRAKCLSRYSRVLGVEWRGTPEPHLPCESTTTLPCPSWFTGSVVGATAG